MIADTSGLLAYYNAAEPAHQRVKAAVESAVEPLVVSPFVVAELDYLLAARVGVDAELAVLRELGSGAYELPALTPADLVTCAQIVERYADQKIGVTDASLVLLAQRFDTRIILTLDHRHFDVLKSLHGKTFVVVP
ncbi:MAG TPA: PIN domain-containing protein [Mycobacteriales bacterium]|nr:PIN domain-containing protein [Mycobacteriales bacterium]